METILLKFDYSSKSDSNLFKAHLPENLIHEVMPDLPKPVIETAMQTWEDRARSEYIGVLIMRKLHSLLIEVNAPTDLQYLALTMENHEMRHAMLCVEAAASLGHNREISFFRRDLTQDYQPRQQSEALLKMICGTLICGESIAFEMLTHSLAVLPETSFRNILRSIAKDETLHAGIGIEILEGLRKENQPCWLDYPGDIWVENFIRKFLEEMEKRPVIDPEHIKIFESSDSAEQLSSLGIAPPIEVLNCYKESISTIVPAKLKSIGLLI